MEREQYDLYNKIYNELVKRKVSRRQMEEPDKYEREDAFMGAILDIEKGVDAYETFRDSFESVHGVELSKIEYESAYHLYKGF